MKKNIEAPNLIERAISAISPQWALERHKARVATAVSGGYVGGSYSDRFTYWTPPTQDADGDTVGDLASLRTRSRDLVRNNPIAGGAIETQTTHVVGTGLSLQCRIDAQALGITPEQATDWNSATEREFSLWADSEFCDVSGEQNFYEMQDLVFRSRFESGDVGVLLAGKKREGWPYELSLQVIEADRISNEDNKADTPTLVQGIERSSDGEAIAAWVSNRHPGATTTAGKAEWTRIEMRGQSGRRNFLHLKRKLRPGQTRGVPELAPIMALIKQVGRYSDAEVDAAVNSAAMAIFTKMDPEAFTDVFDDEGQQSYVQNSLSWDGKFKSGSAINLLPGESIETASMTRPNPNFDGFISAVMMQAGMALNIPSEVLMQRFNSSYSASRAALLAAWRTFRIRREWLSSKFCQPVFEEWLAEAVSAGRVIAPGFFVDAGIRKAWCGTKWSGDGPGALDPYKEAQAAGERISIGLTTLPEEIVAYDGGDWETKHREQSHVQAEREESGLAAPVDAPLPGAAAPASGEQTKEPKPEDDKGDGE